MKTSACSLLRLAVVLVTAALCASATVSPYTNYYLEDHCSPAKSPDRYHARTEVQSISFGAKSPLQERLDERGCRAGLSFTTFNDTYGFLVTPVSIDIPRGPTNSCVNFIWFDGLEEDDLNGKRLCGDSFPKTSAVRTKSDRFTIWWSSEPSSDLSRKAAFNVVIASYVNRSSEAECPESWRRCSNGACLEPRVWCDGIDNCGDGTDEAAENCSPSTVLSIPGIVIIAVIVALVLIAVVVVALICKRRRAHSVS